MKEENKILFTDLNSISDPEFRQIIQNEKRQIYKRRAQTSKYGEQTEGSKYQGSQYRASQNQGSRFNEAHREGATDEGQGSETNLPGNFSQYFDYLDGTKNDFPNY